MEEQWKERAGEKRKAGAREGENDQREIPARLQGREREQRS